MANMDGSNSKVLHQNQRDPVGQYESLRLAYRVGPPIQL